MREGLKYMASEAAVVVVVVVVSSRSNECGVLTKVRVREEETDGQTATDSSGGSGR